MASDRRRVQEMAETLRTGGPRGKAGRLFGALPAEVQRRASVYGPSVLYGTVKFTAASSAIAAKTILEAFSHAVGQTGSTATDGYSGALTLRETNLLDSGKLPASMFFVADKIGMRILEAPAADFLTKNLAPNFLATFHYREQRLDLGAVDNWPWGGGLSGAVATTQSSTDRLVGPNNGIPDHRAMRQLSDDELIVFEPQQVWGVEFNSGAGISSLSGASVTIEAQVKFEGMLLKVA